MLTQRSTPQIRRSVDQHRPPNGEVDRERMVSDHLPLVRKLCRKFFHSGEPIEDLIQVGCIGLLKAINKFDPYRGSTFIDFAIPVIMGEIKNYFRDHG